ncbi:MAG: response regulator [Deltaproteobacteria bacterium]|nr:response regulator [Deltaproteobacteria bacterium]
MEIRQRGAEMQATKTEHERAWETIQHLNAVLRAIRNVSQLIVREKDRYRLLKGICDSLIETRGYYNAWIALLDENEKLVTAAESDLGEGFSLMLNRLNRGEFPACSRKALMQSEVVVTEDPLSTCTDCPLVEKYEGRGGMTVRVEYGGKVYGLLAVSVPAEFISDEEEHSLFKELAVDMGFALHDIELEEERDRMEEKLQGSHDRLEIRVQERTAELAKLNEELRSEITGHKRAEEALRESEEKYRKLYDESKRTAEVYLSLLHTSADAIVICDMERKARYTNPSFTEIFGWTVEEIEGKRIPFLPESEREATMAGIKEIVEKGKALQDFETKRYTRDGCVIDVNISGFRYNDHDGKPAGMLVILRDTSERKKLETQLRQAHKMEAVGTLAGGIAHDFNNILQAISGYAQILLMEKKSGDPDYKRLEVIETAAQKASELTNQLMIFSRKVESKLRPVDINQEVREVSKMLDRTVPKMIELELHLAEDLKVINADPGQLEQIVMNLGVNARDAMPEGGKLIFETTNVVLDGEYCKMHLGASPGEYVMLSVSDTGHGMDRETLEHIFEPFYTTKGTGKGTGLGLAMVYGIVKSHGGYIMCYSETGQGARFKIYFPVVNAEVEERGEEKKEAEEMPGGTETILLVDDEETILAVGKDMLQRFGYKTITAQSGEKAVEIFGREKGHIDLVILDVGMPGIGGHKCMKKLFEIDPKVKVVISSGYSANGKVRETLESGAAGFIGKPYLLTDMLKRVRQILDKG